VVVFGVVGLVAKLAPGLETAVGCVVSELQASLAMGGDVFADVFPEEHLSPDRAR